MRHLFYNNYNLTLFNTVGMTLWYIGAGLGHGNPYGVVIALVSLSFFSIVAQGLMVL